VTQAASSAGLKLGQGKLGESLLAAGRSDYEGAVDALARAVRLRPTDAQYLGDLGYALLRTGDLQGARLLLGQAAELDPGNARILGNLALLLVLQGEDHSAQEIMTRGQLSPQARDRVYRLAAEIRRPLSSQEPAAMADAGRPLVRASPAGPLPTLQRPMLEGLTNPRLVQ
ncbi:putative lipoprotein (partial), partial [Bordetella avium 197N]